MTEAPVTAPVTFALLVGDAMSPHLPALAQLRISVFREWPYLYAGSLSYEATYLERYARSPRSLLVLASCAGEVVGASTAMPLSEESEEVRRPFEHVPWPIASALYLGESVLLPAFRGRGVGARFFLEREAHAARLGLPVTTFCAVERPETHPARPSDYVPLHDFWRRRGYERRAELRTEFSWTDVGDSESTRKPLVFWVKGDSAARSEP